MKPLSGPRTPGLLQKLQWSLNPVGYLDNAASRFPDIFEARITPVGTTQVLVSQPAMIQTLLADDLKGEFAAPVVSMVRPVLGDQSLFLQDGDRHRRQRKLLMPPFHGERMIAYGQLICCLTDQLMQHLPVGQPFSARTVMEDISLEVILEAVFGLSASSRAQQLKQLLIFYSGVFQSPLFNVLLLFPALQRDMGFWSPWQHFLRKRQQLDDLLYSEICDRTHNPNGTDILSLLLATRDEDGQSMSAQEIRDQLLTLLFTGHETTATALAWALYWIHAHPEIHTKLLAEIDGLGDRPDPMDLFRLPYLTAVCQETLRIYPVVPISGPRIVKQPMELMGYRINPGSALHCCIYSTHHRPELYPQSKQFKPERFLERQFSPHEFLPFGGGNRRCIGAALAMFEMKLVLGTILSRYALTLASNKPVKPVRSSITLVPSGGVPMILQGQRIKPPAEKPVAHLV